jgi:hypothetical protein
MDAPDRQARAWKARAALRTRPICHTTILPPNPRWGMSEQGSKMTGMDAAPHEHRDVRTQGLQGCAGIAIFPEGC